MSSQEVFNQIYTDSKWGYLSGPGSDPKVAKLWIDIVNQVIQPDNVRSILEVGCGDWRIGANYNLDGKLYIGVDVSSEILKDRVSTDTLRFILGDAVTMELPTADVILIKDVLQHLPTEQVSILIKKLSSLSPIVLICNDYDAVNQDTHLGGYRGLNLKAEPFNLNLVDLGSFTEGFHLKLIQKLIKDEDV